MTGRITVETGNRALNMARLLRSSGSIDQSIPPSLDVSTDNFIFRPRVFCAYPGTFTCSIPACPSVREGFGKMWMWMRMWHVWVLGLDGFWVGDLIWDGMGWGFALDRVLRRVKERERERQRDEDWREKFHDCGLIRLWGL